MRLLTRIPYFGALAILAYMPLHIFLSQWLSLATGNLEVWKIGKDVLLFALALFTVCLVFWQGRANKGFRMLCLITLLYSVLHMVLWAVHPDIYERSAILGSIYNIRLPVFAVLGFGAALLWPRFAFSSVVKVIVIVSTCVAAMGVLQYFAPSDTLTHFGYSLERGVRPVFFIDDNPAFPRVMSTLREPNALGAYLLLPFLALVAYVLRTGDIRKRALLAAAIAVHVLAIVLTFSRSAWAAVIVGLLFLLWWQYRSQIASLIKRFLPALIVCTLLVVAGGFAARNSAFFHQYLVHRNQSEAGTGELNSNDYHSLLVRQGLEGIARQPLLGHGPGTAGIVSIQNPNGGQLTENYFVQIGYEVGIFGLLIFVALNIWLYVQLWRRKDMYGAVLCAAFWAYLVTNMLLHTWSNEAVAAQWWILAGLALVATSKAPPK